MAGCGQFRRVITTTNSGWKLALLVEEGAWRLTTFEF